VPLAELPGEEAGMTVQELARLAEATRDLQKRYFADRYNRTVFGV
jgi:hypothetical protein